MRFLFGSVLLALASTVSLAPSAQAGMVNPDPTDTLSLKFGTGSFGGVVFDGQRTLDGKNFYKDDSLSRSNRDAPFSGAFGAVGDNNTDGRHAGSSNSPTSSSPGTFGAGGGTGNFSPSSDGGNGGSSGGGSSGKGFYPLEFAYTNLKADHDDGKGGSSGAGSKGLNPLEFAYADLKADHDGFQGLGDGGAGAGKGGVSATPLPPAWTLMLMGLGFFGLVHRLRKNEKVFTVA